MLSYQFLKSRFTGEIKKVNRYRKDRQKNENRIYLAFKDCLDNLIWIRKDCSFKHKSLNTNYYLCDYPPYSIHRKKRSRFYNIWAGIKSRCNSKNSKNYKYYGKRGIKTDINWKHFVFFYKDMFNTYKENLTIERIDVNKGYFKENCKWIPQSEQSMNTRKNVKITINGETKIIKEWADIYNIKQNTITTRIVKYKWDKVKAVITPVISK